MEIGQAIEKFELYITSERRLAAGTVRNYMEDVRSLERYLSQQGAELVEEIGSRDVRGWQMENMESGLSAGTVKKQLSSIRSWFRFMRKNGWVDGSVMAKVSAPKLPKHLPIFFKEGEVERIYSDGVFSDDFEGERDRLMLRVLYETGMRRSELAGLRIGSVDLSSLYVKVLGKRNKERMIPIEGELAHNIERYLPLREEVAQGTESLFVTKKGEPITAQGVYRVVKKYMVALSNADRISPHVFRHSFATHMLNEGANIDAIKELLGHTDLAATEVYTHVTREHLKEAYNHAHPRAMKPKKHKPIKKEDV